MARRVTPAPITVCIGTYGNRQVWSDLVHRRALPSVDRQTMPPHNTIWLHGPTLHEARNGAAAEAKSDWLCFLDADDELDPRYLEAMTAAIGQLDDGDWLLQPATLGFYPDGNRDAQPALIPTRPLTESNYLVVSTLIRRDQFNRIGGFADLPVLEDWELWLRATDDGVNVKAVPDAILRIHYNPKGRNQGNMATYATVAGQLRSRYKRR